MVGVDNGQQAVEAARREPFHVLVTDLRMPVLDGLSAYKEIQATPRNTDMALVVMTGYGTLQTAIDAIGLGVYEFVLKPFHLQELIEAVERALQRKRLQREVARLNALFPLLELSQALMGTVDLDDVLRQVVHIARDGLGATTATLMLVDADKRLVVRSAEGPLPPIVDSEPPRLGQGIAGCAAASREPAVVSGLLRDDPWAVQEFGRDEVAAAISVPLVRQDSVLGVLNVARSPEEGAFEDGAVEFLSILAGQAAAAIENARLFGEIRQAYERLAELDHLKGEFLNIAAHELRSPLAVILAYATILEDEATGPMRQHFSQVVQAAMQLKSVIDEMVSLQRLDTGEAQAHIEELELAPVIEEVIEDVRLMIERKEQHITIKVPVDLPPVQADRQVLQLVLGSLISNATKFTPEGGSVTVGAYRKDDNLCVYVQDTGVGIKEEELERIFDRFYQVENSLRREHGGIGLGLAIAKEMATLIGGEISVASRVGHGSTFTLSLPICKQG